MINDAALHGAVAELLRKVSAEIILPRHRQLTADEIFDKGGGDPVTVADHEAEEMLIEGLERIVPGLAIVGEEGAHAAPDILERLAGDCWIVDPLDGTRNFASGKAPFGILLAMASGGEAHTGWIYDCLSGRLCIARKGGGAFLDGEKIVARTSSETPPIAAISTYFMELDKRAAVERDILPHYQVAEIPFCCAEQYPRLALGTNDLSLFERTEPWDHAAGVLWLNEAGGKAARPDGSPYRVGEWRRRGLIAAASPALWDDLADRLATLSGP